MTYVTMYQKFLALCKRYGGGYSVCPEVTVIWLCANSVILDEHYHWPQVLLQPCPIENDTFTMR